jgi:hypothetical protein
VRHLYRVEDDEPLAYERNRRDFHLVSDDTLWAHESHAWLLSAASSAILAHRIGNTYYDTVSGVALYYERDDPSRQPTRTPLASVSHRGARR